MIDDACLASIAKCKCLAIEERGTRTPTDSLPTPDEGQGVKAVDKARCFLGKIGEKSLCRRAPTSNKHKTNSPSMRGKSTLLKFKILAGRKGLLS